MTKEKLVKLIQKLIRTGQHFGFLTKLELSKLERTCGGDKGWGRAGVLAVS
jgi:hypothetical protein